MRHRLSLALAAALLLVGTGEARQAAQQPAPATRAQESFASRVAALSEPGGYFNTDNLISNEKSFLHVAPDLRALSRQASTGGVYLGVGPDQNFSYIAHLRPSMAILIDIRRDNLLLHLLFKAIFAESRTRGEYLALLTGRAPPAVTATSASIEDIVAAVDRAAPLAADRINALRARLAKAVDGFGVALSNDERTTIDAFHRQFIADGLSLRFNTTGRAPQIDYPTYRDLLLERDLTGARQGFLATDDDFQFVKQLQARDLVIPIVGDLAGTKALGSVARFLTSSQLRVSAFYTSNVEQYLFRDGSFARWIDNLARLPRQPRSLIVRSIFPSGGTGISPRPGYNCNSVTQAIETLVTGYANGQFRQYWELVR